MKQLLFAVLCFTSLVRADGLIVIPPLPHPRPSPAVASPYPLAVRYHHVETVIRDMDAFTSVDQEFYNPTGSRLEGYYLFPVPEGAVIGNFSMEINGKETPAELLDAEKARSVYEDIVRKLVDPALLEYYGRGMFRARIFPIEPYGTKRVKISYRQPLERNNGTIGYTYPLATEKFSSAPVADVSIRVTVRTRDKLKSVYCPSHETTIARNGNQEAVIGYEVKNAKPDRDFSVFYSTDNSTFGISLLTFREQGSKGYFFLNISPDYDSGPTDFEEKDITFVLDVSGSMAGQKLEQAKKALRFCVANLNKGDRFEIIRFSTEAEALFGQPTPADSGSRTRAGRFIDGLRAIGGTNIEEALSMALAATPKDGRPTVVLFITDGKPTIGKTGEVELLESVKKPVGRAVRIFTFGIGDDLNTHLLDKLSRISSAYRTYVTPDEDIEVKLSDLYTKIQSPVFTGLTIDVAPAAGARLVHPKTVPDLFRGSSITLLGRYGGHGAVRISLKGTVRGKPTAITFNAEFPKIATGNSFIANLWAARRIGFLLDQIRLNGEDRELVDEVTSLARTHGIITPYTSYLIVEDEETQVRQDRLPEKRRSLGSMLPESGRGFTEDKRKEYAALHAKAGAPSTRASSEIQALAGSQNSDQIVQGGSRLSFVATDGTSRNLAQQVRTISGRTFYYNGTGWTDIALQRIKGPSRQQRIRFGSSDYFGLLRKSPEAAFFMSLGKNVSFALAARVIEIYE